MKKLFLAVIAAMITAFSANAQVKIESPHPDLEVKISRCSVAGGKVVIDMVLTNYGSDANLCAINSHVTAYDDEGNTYDRKNTSIVLGPTSHELKVSNKYTLPQDVPLKFRIQIDGISADASKLALLKFAPNSVRTADSSMNLDWDDYVVIRNLEWAK